jgi:deoxyribodipyrimidine photo-lyase
MAPALARQEALACMDDFAAQQIGFYQSARDFPAKPGTNQLSALPGSWGYFIRQCLRSAGG